MWLMIWFIVYVFIILFGSSLIEEKWRNENSGKEASNRTEREGFWMYLYNKEKDLSNSKKQLELELHEREAGGRAVCLCETEM